MTTFTRSLSIQPATVDDDARTVEVVWSTGAPVRRRDAAGPYTEALSLDPAHVNLSRLNGASVLANHDQRSLSSVLGVVENARTDGTRGTATLRFSARPDVEPIWQDVRAGIIRSVSVGYSVEQWQDTTNRGERTRTAVRWTPFELSLVPVPADPAATIRGATMSENTTAEPVSADTETRSATETLNRGAINAEIRSIAKVTGLGQDWIDSQIDQAVDLDTARARAFDALKRRSNVTVDPTANRVEVGTDHDDPEVRARQMGEALYTRCINPKHELSDAARRYAYATPADCARELLTLRGISVTGQSPASLITRSLHSTSDFAIILGDTIGRTVRLGYQAAPAGIKAVGRQTTARDFRSKTTIQLSEAPTLERVGEGGEFKSGTFAEAKESYKIDTYGRIVGITRQVLVNDDLGAFGDVARRLGAAAAEFEAQLMVNLLTSNSGAGPIMDDIKALFHADHGNLAAAGAVISDTTLSAARLAMRTQTGLTGQIISVTPRYLVVPPALETTAEKWLATIAAAQAQNVNPFSGKLTLVVEPRLNAKSATGWYVVADPSEIEGLEFSYLAGAEGPQIESKSGFEVDGVQVRVRLDFGAGFIDHRGWFRNAGA